jgi:glycosyltransferase involved in cell wall biosynthesis
VRVLFLLPYYGTATPTGAFITSREYALGLVAAGHTVDVVLTRREPGTVHVEDGVRVWPEREWWSAVRTVRPELVISHHGDRRAPQMVQHLRAVPHLLMVHGLTGRPRLGAPALAWFPSHACRDHYRDYRGRALVLPPPVDPGLYRTRPGTLVTMNGTAPEKGPGVLAEVAARMPDERFLLVESYGYSAAVDLPNVEIAGRMDPRALYARTRLLLMPSTTESYGRVGVEAMLSGIPVIASPLPGIREALGDAAVYVPRDRADRWVEEVRRLSAPAAYAAASGRALAHAEGLDHAATVAAFTAACERLARPVAPVRARRPAVPPPVEDADVVAWVHFGVPYRRAGSETMLHTMMRALVEAGLSGLVVCSDMREAPAGWDVDGVPYRHLAPAAAADLVRALRPKVVVTHHDFAEQAIILSHETGARSLLLVHNDFDRSARALAAGPDLAVYNTRWVLESLTGRYPEQVRAAGALVVHPPVLPDEHRAPRPGTHVTLVNLSRHKGVDTWRAVAGLRRDLPFLGVMGAHGEQVARITQPNMRIARPTSDMRRDVWARTRVLMVPSVYESYGMAAVEALASGLPVIAHPTPGLREALGEAGTFVDRADCRAWAATVRGLYRNGPRREEATAAAVERSAFLADQTRHELKLWTAAVQDLAHATVRKPGHS